jgi:hypothetical protein
MKTPVLILQATAILALATVSSLHAGSNAQPWTWRAPLPQGNNLNAAAYSPTFDTIVAVGDLGTVLTKTADGAWTSKVLGPKERFVDVNWTGSRFIILSYDGLRYSTDGSTWQTLPPNDVSKNAGFLASSANSTVALGWNGPAWVSSDAERKVWKKLSLPALPRINYAGSFTGSGDRTGYYDDISTDGNKTFVAVGTGGTIVTSLDDGKTWKKIASNTELPIASVASNGSGFVAVGSSWNSTTNQNATVILKSADGVTWSSGTAPISDNFGSAVNFSRVFARGSGYVASSSGECFTSPDGSTWTSIGMLNPDDWSDWILGSVRNTSGNNSTILVGGAGMVASLDDAGVLHTEITDVIGGSNGLWGPSFSAAGLGNVFVAIDRNDVNGTRQIGSADGVAFLATPGDSSTRSVVRRIGDKLVSAADGGDFASTTDGASWSPLGSASGITGNVATFAAASTSSTAVALAIEQNWDENTYTYTSIPRLYVSNDWKIWTEITLPAGALPSYSSSSGELSPDLQWDGNKFLLLTPSGKLYSSTDGSAWTKLPELPSDSAAFVSANFGNGSLPANLVASFASNGSTIVARSAKSSKDGYVWISGPDRFFVFSNGAWKQQGPSESSWMWNNNVVWNGALFASASNDGMLDTSTDGVNWTRRQLGAQVQQLVWTGSQLVGVTSTFGILTHLDGLSPRINALYTDISPSSKEAASAGGNYTIVVDSNQPWKAVETLPWVTVAPLSGSNAGNVTVTVLPNTTPLSRSGIVTIGGRSHTINQASFISSSSPAQTVGYGGTTYTVDVASTLPWKITNPASAWVTVSASPISANGTVPPGNATVTFTVKPQSQPNANPTIRTAVVSLGGVLHTITQEAAPRSIIGSIGTFTVPVTSKSEWTATSNATWTLLSKTSGTGAGSVVVTLQENPTSASRTATLTISGLNYSVTQQGQTIPLLHKGTYTGLVFTGAEPALSDGTSSVFEGITDAMGGITLTVTPTTQGNATYTGSLRLNGLTYTGRGAVVTSAVPWTISCNWTAPTRPVSTATVSLNFVVNFTNAKLVRGTVDDGLGGNYGLLAGKPVFDGSSAIFPDAGSYVSMIGTPLVWPAATSISISAAGLATFAGKFVDGTALTMSVPIFGATGLDAEWGLLFYNSIYGTKGTLGGFYCQSPDAATPGTILANGLTTAWVPARPELPATDVSGKLADDSAAPFLLNSYVKPATGQPAIIWPSGNATTSYGTTDVPAIDPYPDMISGRVNLVNKTNVLSWAKADAQGGSQLNPYKVTFAFAPTTGLLEGSFTIKVSHPDDPETPLGTRVVKFYGIANQDYDNLRANDGFQAFFLSPTIKVKSLSDPLQWSESTGAVGEMLIIPEMAP